MTHSNATGSISLSPISEHPEIAVKATNFLVENETTFRNTGHSPPFVSVTNTERAVTGKEQPLEWVV